MTENNVEVTEITEEQLATLTKNLPLAAKILVLGKSIELLRQLGTQWVVGSAIEDCITDRVQGEQRVQMVAEFQHLVNTQFDEMLGRLGKEYQDLQCDALITLLTKLADDLDREIGEQLGD